MGKTNIEWATDVWNPVTGCTKVSEGCRNCYAERVVKRFGERVHGLDQVPSYPDFIGPGDAETRHFTDVACHPDRLDQPLHWRKPRTIFVCSMGDLFHDAVPDEFIAAVLAENDITLPMVAAYLATYSKTVVPGPLPTINWTAGEPRTYPITHHIALIAVGVGGTSLPYYLPNAVGAKAALVAAVDSHGNISRISLAGWDDTEPAHALPGLQRFVAALDGRTIQEVEN